MSIDVFGIDIDRFLGPGALCGEGEDEFIFSSSHTEDAEPGSLFGALLGRRINAASAWYQLGDFTLSLRSLPEDGSQPEIVPEGRSGQQGGMVNECSMLPAAESEAKHYEREGEEKDGGKLEMQEGPAQHNNLMRPYLQFATQRQFSAALYGSTYLQSCREVRETLLVDLTLLALQGIGSDVYCEEGPFPVIHVLGHSLHAITSLLRGFGWFYRIRRLLDAATESLSCSRDPAQLALAAGIRDVLYVCNASLSAARSAYADGENGSSGVVPSLADVWKSTALHRSALSNLLAAVAPHSLMQQLDWAKRDSSTAWNRATYTLLEPAAWSGVHRSSGWQLFDDVYKNVDRLRTVVWRGQGGLFHSRGGDDDDNEPSDSQASLLIASCLLRRVSIPLLALLQRLLFQIELDPDTEMVAAAEELGITLPISAEALWASEGGNAGDMGEIGGLLASQFWSNGRIALLASDRSSAAASLLQRCRHLEMTLVMPLHRRDIDSLLIGAADVERCYALLSADVRQRVDVWACEGVSGVVGHREKEGDVVAIEVKVGNLAAKNNQDQEGGEEEVAADEMEKTSQEIAPLTPGHAAVAGSNYFEGSQKGDADQSATISLMSPISLVREVDACLVEEAYAAIIEKYEALNRSVMVKHEATRWRSQRMATIGDSQNQLGRMFEQERLLWARELVIHKRYLKENPPSAIENPLNTKIQPNALVPGGDSHLSLADGGGSSSEAGGAATGERSSVRVSNAPGGDSHLSLADGSLRIARNLETLVEHEADVSMSAMEAIAAQNPEVQETIHANVVDSHLLFTVDHARLLRPDAGLEEEDATATALSSFWRGLQLLAAGNGLSSTVSPTATEGAGSVLLRPLASQMSGTLCRLVRVQCEVLDQAALLSAIDESALLRHIDSIDDVFLLSPRSDFASLLCATLVESHLERFPFRSSTHQQELLRAKYHQQPSREHSVLWSPASVSMAFARTVKYCSLRNAAHLAHASLHISIQSGDALLSTLAHEASAQTPSDAIFSARGLESIEISYAAPWPLCTIYTPEMLASLCVATRRVLELCQIATLVRLAWGDIRCLKLYLRDRDGTKNKSAQRPSVGATADPEGLSLRFFALCDSSKAVADGRMREMYTAFRLVQHSLRALLDFSSDRLRALQLRLRDDMASRCRSGLSGAIWALKRYAHDVPVYLFARGGGVLSLARAGEAGSIPHIPHAICGVLEACRSVLGVLAKLTSCSIEPSDAPAVVAELHGLVALLRSHGALLREACSHQDGAANRLNAQCLSMLFPDI